MYGRLVGDNELIGVQSAYNASGIKNQWDRLFTTGTVVQISNISNLITGDERYNCTKFLLEVNNNSSVEKVSSVCS